MSLGEKGKAEAAVGRSARGREISQIILDFLKIINSTSRPLAGP